uniref:Zinc transporter ZIP6 n=1 Tax=Denticeps clupeoides TaxID=299321 RepID=A0AAY4AL79_9TELE
MVASGKPCRLLSLIGLLCWMSPRGEAGPDCGGVSVPTDESVAHQAQLRHLHILFERYGKNGSITLEGLEKLLKRLGISHMHRVTVKHQHLNNHTHKSAGVHAMEERSHTSSEPQKPTQPPKPEKVDLSSKEVVNISVGKKSQSDADYNLYTKRGQLSTTPPPMATSAAIRRAQRNAGYDLKQDHSPTSHVTLDENTVTVAYQTEVQETSHEEEHDGHQHNQTHTQECLNASSILRDHGISSETITVSDFVYLCPALLTQIDSNSCIRENQFDHNHDDDPDHNHHHHDKDTSIMTAWIGGILSISIISVLALVGVILVPLINRTSFNFLLSFLVALAVGTLSGDAFLHLIPQAQGHHNHHHASHNESLEHGVQRHDEDSLRSVWTGLTALGGVYFMFLIEHFLTLGKMYKDKKHKVQKRFDQNKDGLDSEKLPAMEENDIKPLEEGEPNGNSAVGRGLSEEEEVMLAKPVEDVYSSQDCQNKCHSHFHDTVGQPDELRHHHHDYHHILHHHHSQNHHPHTHTHRHTHSYNRKHFQEAGVATLAWMVIMGDGLHNFSDGLAIGAAFTEGFSSGLSTSVAVFCHELPHELGDFAVLLKAGMSVRQAVLYNLLSAMMAFLGMAVGILIGQYVENVATWIFALTAGLFLYVALVDMVPEMLHNDANEQGFSHYGYFLLQNAGILLGFGIMLLIAVLEPQIQFNLNL